MGQVFLMLYSYFIKKVVRQSFDHVNNQRWDELLNPVAPNVHHRFAGAHSIGGERHDKEAMHRWRPAHRNKAAFRQVVKRGPPRSVR
jgi:hypothetical protein